MMYDRAMPSRVGNTWEPSCMLKTSSLSHDMSQGFESLDIGKARETDDPSFKDSCKAPPHSALFLL